MKVLHDNSTAEFPPMLAHTFTLPQGLIGFASYTRAELLYVPDNLPFLWMKIHNDTDSVHFVVIEPGGVIDGYQPELFDEDASNLDLADPAEAMVLNIVSLTHQSPLDATVNLVGPIVVNRRTRLGRQLVIANYSRYDAHHPLVEATSTPARATA